MVFHYGLGGTPVKAIELFEEQDDNGFEFKNKTWSLIHHLLSRGPSLECSSIIAMLPLVANPQLLLVLELDTHVDVGYVSDEFCEFYFEDLIN